MKKIGLFLMFLFLALFVIGCGEQTGEVIKITDLTIGEVAELEVDETFNVVLTYDKSAEVDFEWSSSDASIVKVENGKLTALKEGTVTITVKEKNSLIEKSVEVTVKAKEVEDGGDDNKDENEDKKDQITDEIKELFETYVSGLPKNTSEDLPLLDGYNVSFVFDSGVAADGKVTRSEENQSVTGKVVLTVGEAKIEKEYTVSITGTFLDDFAKEFIAQFGSKIDGKMNIEKSFDDYGGTYVRWESENPEIFDNKGNLYRPLHDTYITITYTIKTNEPKAEATYSSKILACGQELKYKNKLLEEWICKSIPENTILYPGDILPTECEELGAKITWLDKNGQAADLEKLATDPVLGDAVVLTVRAVYPDKDKYLDFVLDYRVWNKKFNNDSEKVDALVNSIGGKDIRAYAYKSRGYDYENNGYIYFFENVDSVINTEYMLDVTYKYIRTGIKHTSTEYVVVHDTAGGLPTHTAESFAQNQQQKNTNEANREYISWHFTVGTDGIYQSLPTDEVAYHAGDGSHVYGDIWSSGGYNDRIGGGNRNGIGIESCINNGTDYNDTIRILAKLVAELLLQYNLSTDRVKQHWHFSGKDCPAVIRHCNRWEEFLNLVKIEYFVKTELKDAEFTWTSSNLSLLSTEGKVLKFGENLEVPYKVSVKFNGETKEYSFVSKVIYEEEVYESL